MKKPSTSLTLRPTSIIHQALEGIKRNEKAQEEMQKRFDKEWNKWGIKRGRSS